MRLNCFLNTLLSQNQNLSQKKKSEQNSVPIADAGGPYAGVAGIPLLFDGSGSSDSDGDNLAYIWDFGDGTTGTGSTLVHIYTKAGDYIVTLTVMDDMGTTDNDTAESVIDKIIDEGKPFTGETDSYMWYIAVLLCTVFLLLIIGIYLIRKK